MRRRRPRLLDLFSGAGGAAAGYHRAGFVVEGVDHVAQPAYPFAFHQADALEYLAAHGDEFDAVHASPPCQMFSHYRRCRPAKTDQAYVNLIPQTRAALVELGLPYVIENVARAPLQHPLLLCGSMFRLGVRRHRLFESSVMLLAPGGCCHGLYTQKRYPGGASKLRHGHSRAPYRATVEVGTWDIPLSTQREAMGIDWMDVRELSQAIPPAYTAHLGRQLLRVVQGKTRAS